MRRARSRATAISEARASRNRRSEPSKETLAGATSSTMPPRQRSCRKSGQRAQRAALRAADRRRPRSCASSQARSTIARSRGPSAERPRRRPSARSSPPRSSKPPVARALDHADAPRVQRLEQPLREAARQLGGIGGGGHHRHRVQQQPHVAIVLGLVSGEDALQPIEAAARARRRSPSPRRARRPTLPRLAALSAWSARRISSWSVHVLAGLGHRQAGAELQAQDAPVVPVVSPAGAPRSPPPSGRRRASCRGG